MIRLGTHPLANLTLRPWPAAIAGAAVLAALSVAAAYPAKADDVSRPGRPNYVQYEHDAVVHSQQLTETRAADAAAREDRAMAAEQDHNMDADQNGARQTNNLGTPNASTNQ
jgi:hypothetical protein